MIWEPLNCGSFVDKIYLRLHENVLEISLKIVYERIWAFLTRGTSHLKIKYVSTKGSVTCQLYSDVASQSSGILTYSTNLCNRQVRVSYTAIHKYLYTYKNTCIIIQIQCIIRQLILWDVSEKPLCFYNCKGPNCQNILVFDKNSTWNSGLLLADGTTFRYFLKIGHTFLGFLKFQLKIKKL